MAVSAALPEPSPGNAGRAARLTTAQLQHLSKILRGRHHTDFGNNSPLALLLEPLQQAIHSIGAAGTQRTEVVQSIVAQMGRSKRTYWAWTASEWHSAYKICKREAPSVASTLIAVAYVVYGINLLASHRTQLGLVQQHALACKIFSRKACNDAISAVCTELVRIGYTGNQNDHVRVLLSEVFLIVGSTDLSRITTDVLERVRSGPYSRNLKSYTYMLSHALSTMGMMDAPLPQIDSGHPREKSRRSRDGIDPAWCNACDHWYEISTAAKSTREEHRSRLLGAGRWLATHHPEISRPEQWTRQVAAEYVAAVNAMKVGDYVSAVAPVNSRNGLPLTPSARSGQLAAMRALFMDLFECEEFQLPFDPRVAFATPRTVLKAKGPNPRVIEDDIWGKLLWAGLNLQESDLRISRSPNGDQRGPRRHWSLSAPSR
jgi:hypothetical protein